ncbi:hypothetical protein DFS33DRAFT_1474315 [Desarmillaria ectypa]|nr:hypothetical protein DFS33DRAFT_1474315 [Desarmillaria ectypa]
MQAPSQPLTQSQSAAAPVQSPILTPPNLAPDDTDWISNASLTFKVLAGAGEVEPSGIAKAIANIALPILELAQNHEKACEELKDTIKYLDEMLRYVSEEVKLLQDGRSLTDGSTHRLARLQQMGDEFVSHLKDLKDDLNKIYGKTGFRAKMKKTFQRKAILDRVNQHKEYVKEARDKLVATAVLSVTRQVASIHDHLMSPSRMTQPVKYVFVYSLKYNRSHDSLLISSIMLSAIPPPPPFVFEGRNDLVQEGVANLLADSSRSIIIMGFGGMGKTSLALKLLDDPAVKAKYKAYRYFIPCDIVCGVEPTVEVLLQALIKMMKWEWTNDVIEQLHTISKPTVLVFDNFETLWDNSKKQHDIQRLLEQLNSIIYITLIITMRGTTPPIEDSDWLVLPYKGLVPLAISSSLAIFNAISGCRSDIEIVIKLLEELAGWPLAIILIAHQAKILSPKVLLESWNHEKTLLLVKPRAQSDRLTNVDVSIKITLQSSLLSSEPNTLKLLSVICNFPNGIPTWANLLRKMLPDLSERTSIICNLLDSGIIYEDSKGGLKLLPPIQEYLKIYFQQPDIYIKKQFCTFYLNEIEGKQLQNITSQENTQFGLSHLNNIEWILNDILNNDVTEKELINIYHFCWFQYNVSESDILLKKVMDIIKNRNIKYLHAQLVLLWGFRLSSHSQWIMAQEKIKQALEMFEKIEDTLGVAQCLQGLGNILRMMDQYSEARTKLEQALEMFEKIGDTLGAAQCLKILGNTLGMMNQYSEARTKFKQALEMFEKIGHTLGVAQCLQGLGNILRMMNQYSEARTKFKQALEMFEKIGHTLGAAQCLQGLGNILRMMDQYSEARTKLEQALEMFEKIGDTLGAAQCLKILGNTLGMMNQYSEARTKFKQALEMFEKIGRTLGVAQCLQGLGNILRMMNQYSEARTKLEQALEMFEKIGRTLGVAQCLQGLGNILKMMDQYSEARTKFKQALEMFEKIGHTLGVAQCLQGLGSILRMMNQYSEARTKFKQALEMFEKIGHTLGVAQCLQGLGNILRMMDQYSEARTKLEQALEMFEKIGHTLGVAQCLQDLRNILQMMNQYSEATTE